MSERIRRKVPGTKQSKRQPAPLGKTGAQSPPLDPVLMAQYRQEVGQAWQAVKATYPLRLDTPEAWKDWTFAVYHQYGVFKKYASLYFRPQPLSEEAARYTWDFWRDVELLRGGDQTKVEAAISFLEADPWFHGSGYVKTKLSRYIKADMLTPAYRTRLANVVLSVVDKRHDRDFRAFCRLARKADTPELREQLTRRLAHNDLDVRRRARWVLEALVQKDAEAGSRGASTAA